MIDRHKQLGNGEPVLASVQTESPSAAVPVDHSEGHSTSWFARLRRRWFGGRPAAQDSVDDLSQEVFQRLSRYSDDIAVENPQGYLFRIAANVANEWRDRSRSRRSAPGRKAEDRGWLDGLQIDSTTHPDNAMFAARINRHLQSAVDQLPKRQRDVLLLHVNEGLTYKQIADRLDVTYSIALRELTRAYGALRVQLKAEDL